MAKKVRATPVGEGAWPGRTWDDFGNARRLEDRYQDRLRWVSDNKSWAVYDPATGLWSISANERAQGLARTVIERMADEEADSYSAKESSGVKKGLSRQAEWRAWARQQHSDRAVQSMLAVAKTRKRLFSTMEDFDKDEDKLHCKNGVLDLKTFVLGPHLPGHYLTVGADAEYSPEAVSNAWKRYLRTFLPGRELRHYVQKLVGYSLLVGNPDRMFILVCGTTSTGKSTLREMMNAVLGGYAKAIELSLFRTSQTEKPRADLASALNARFVSATEASAEWKLHADYIKQITGGDTMRARYPHERGYVQRVPAFVPWLFTNAMPTIEGRDKALDHRLVAVPFGRSVADKGEDKGARDRMRRSGRAKAAVLAWAVEGLRLYREEGLAPPKQVVRATRRARAEMSDLDAFLQEKCREGEGLWAVPRELFLEYSHWCIRKKVLEKDRLTETNFGRAMNGRGFEKKSVRVDGLPRRVRSGLELRVKPNEPLSVKL